MCIQQVCPVANMNRAKSQRDILVGKQLVSLAVGMAPYNIYTHSMAKPQGLPQDRRFAERTAEFVQRTSPVSWRAGDPSRRVAVESEDAGTWTAKSMQNITGIQPAIGSQIPSNCLQ